MKKVKIFALMLLAGAAIFSSCKKDETTYADPTISFQNGTTSLVFNGTNSISVNVSFAAEGQIESVTLSGPSLTGTGTTTSTITDKMGTSGTDNAKNETSSTYIFNVSSTDLGLALINHTSGFTYTFTLTDQQGSSTTGTFTVTIPTATGNPIYTFTPTPLGAQSATEGSFFASVLGTGTVYSQANAAANAANIYITYGVIGTTPTIMSLPERGNNGFTAVTGGPAVYYKASSITPAQFDAMTDDLGFSSITASTDAKITVAAGNVYEFVNGTKKGLIKVTAITAGTSGNMTMVVKVQQ
jgi:hypothetical protein